MTDKRRKRTFTGWKKKKRKVRTDPIITLHTECCFCHEGENTTCGILFQDTIASLAVHQFCLFFSAGLAQHGEDTDGFDGFLHKDILKEAQRANKIVCKFCQLPGASSGCCVKTCRLVYHYKCGLDKGVQFIFYDCFDSYCKSHRAYQDLKPLSPRKLSVPYLCPLCLEQVACDYNNVLKTPCCKNVFAHKACLQTQAMTSGYFFRCPMCNDESTFQQEMSKFGIYIPQRDAAWEENNAFDDLLQQYQHCDALRCISPKGNTFTEDCGDWELLRCSHCGQSAIHRRCIGGDEIDTVPNYVCADCNRVTGDKCKPLAVLLERHDERYLEHKKRLAELQANEDPVLLASPVFAMGLLKKKFNIEECQVQMEKLPTLLIQNLRRRKITMKKLSSYGICVGVPFQRSISRPEKVRSTISPCNASTGSSCHLGNLTSTTTKTTTATATVTATTAKSDESNTIDITSTTPTKTPTTILNTSSTMPTVKTTPREPMPTDESVFVCDSSDKPLSRTAAKIMACLSVSQKKRSLSESTIENTFDFKKPKLGHSHDRIPSTEKPKKDTKLRDYFTKSYQVDVKHSDKSDCSNPLKSRNNKAHSNKKKRKLRIPPSVSIFSWVRREHPKSETIALDEDCTLLNRTSSAASSSPLSKQHNAIRNTDNAGPCKISIDLTSYSSSTVDSLTTVSLTTVSSSTVVSSSTMDSSSLDLGYQLESSSQNVKLPGIHTFFSLNSLTSTSTSVCENDAIPLSSSYARSPLGIVKNINKRNSLHIEKTPSVSKVYDENTLVSSVHTPTSSQLVRVTTPPPLTSIKHNNEITPSVSKVYDENTSVSSVHTPISSQVVLATTPPPLIQIKHIVKRPNVSKVYDENTLVSSMHTPFSLQVVRATTPPPLISIKHNNISPTLDKPFSLVTTKEDSPRPSVIVRTPRTALS